MKFLMPLCFAILVFVGCGKKEEAPTALKFDEVITQLLEGKTPQNVPQNVLDEAQAMLIRSENSGYKLITSKQLFTLLEQKKPVVIVSASPRGEYMLGLIPNAKNFAFSTQDAQSDGELKWNEKSPQPQEFLDKLGEDKNALIVFYDGGNAPKYQLSSADIASLWAKKFGYLNVYRLVGGLKAWREEGYPLSQELPSCCNME